MEPDDALGDDDPRSPLLPPDDRLWRHPSEVASFGPPFDDDGPARRAPRTWAVALVAAAAGGLFAVGLVAVAGGFRGPVRPVPVVERVVVPASVVAAPGSTGARALTERLRPAIVAVVAEGGAGGGRGSGVLFRSDGHVLTNSHVVDGASRITVRMADGQGAVATLVGSDAVTDLAVVKVDEWASVPSAPMGSAATLVVGQGVLVLGASPADEGGAPAAPATVSGLGRQVERPAGATLVDMIETDTPVAPAWSGGALLDDRGAVVGIVTAVGTAGRPLGFATPIDLARSVAEQLVSEGRVVRAWIGVDGGDLDRATAMTLGVPGGAVVTTVREGGPAHHAGLAPDDVVLDADGVPVSSMGALRILLKSHRAGDVVTLTVARGGARRSVAVTLAERPSGA